MALGHCILSLTLLLPLRAVSHRIVERRTQLVLNKSSRCEEAFPGALSGHPSCSWGRDLLLTPPAPGTAPPRPRPAANLPPLPGRRLREGWWLKPRSHSAAGPNRIQTPGPCPTSLGPSAAPAFPQHQLAMRGRQPGGRLPVGGGPEPLGGTVVSPGDTRARHVWSVPGSLFPWP